MGTGFFKNNRAISAFKEIRYEDLRKYENISPNTVSPIKTHVKETTLGKTYNASKIYVNAELIMDMTPGIGYDLAYKAIVENGVIETRDRAGWTNRTGAKKNGL